MAPRRPDHDLFIDSLTGEPIPFYLDPLLADDTHALITKHGGTTVPLWPDATFVLVDPHKPSGQAVFRDVNGKKKVLNTQWVRECIEHGKLYTYEHKYGGFLVTGNELQTIPPQVLQYPFQPWPGPAPTQPPQPPAPPPAPPAAEPWDSYTPTTSYDYRYRDHHHPSWPQNPGPYYDTSYDHPYGPPSFLQEPPDGPPPPPPPAPAPAAAPAPAPASTPAVAQAAPPVAAPPPPAAPTPPPAQIDPSPAPVPAPPTHGTATTASVVPPSAPPPPSVPVPLPADSNAQARGRKRNRTQPPPATPAAALVVNRRPSARSPTPPTRVIKSTYGGNLFTVEDVEYLKKYIDYCQDQGLVLSLREICERIAEKAPHHTFYSWRRYCNKHHIRLGGYAMTHDLPPNSTGPSTSTNPHHPGSSSNTSTPNPSSSRNHHHHRDDMDIDMDMDVDVQSPAISAARTAGTAAGAGNGASDPTRVYIGAPVGNGRAGARAGGGIVGGAPHHQHQHHPAASSSNAGGPSGTQGTAQANVPDPRDRSPSPPKALFRSTTGKGVAFTEEDVSFLMRLMARRKAQHQHMFDMVIFWKEVAAKAPHHSRASWMKFWRRHKHELERNEGDAPLPNPPEKKMRYSKGDDVLLAKFFVNKPPGTSDRIFQEFGRLHPHHPWKGWQEHHRIHKTKIESLMARLAAGENIDIVEGDD